MAVFTITEDELKEILDEHLKWLRDEDGGKRADLSSADLSGANLIGTDLRYANLSSANLTGANLSGTDLRGANLLSAKLSDVDLSGTNLMGAKIEDKILNEIYPIHCPETGAFVAWKKARGKIIKLEVCEDAKRSSAFTRKCRCSAAKVLAIENLDGTDSGLTEIPSNYDINFIYKVGEIVRVCDFDDDRKNECAPGIHFFVTRQEAVAW